MASEEISKCMVINTLNCLGKKWIPWIVCELITNETLFFSDLLNYVKSSSGASISSRVLSEALSILEEDMIVIRTVEADSTPIRVSYSLTQKGKDLGVVLSLIKGWGLKWGDLSKKLCKSSTCVHDMIPVIDVDEARKLQHLPKKE